MSRGQDRRFAVQAASGLNVHLTQTPVYVVHEDDNTLTDWKVYGKRCTLTHVSVAVLMAMDGAVLEQAQCCTKTGI